MLVLLHRFMLHCGQHHLLCQSVIINPVYTIITSELWYVLDVTCFINSLFTAQHVSDVNTSILRSLRLICLVISGVALFWYDVCWCYVVVWLGWCGICMQCFSLHPDTMLPQHLVCKNELNCEYCNIILGRNNKAPW